MAHDSHIVRAKETLKFKSESPCCPMFPTNFGFTATYGWAEMLFEDLGDGGQLGYWNGMILDFSMRPFMFRLSPTNGLGYLL